MAKQCSIDGCTKAVGSRGWCPMHYQRWRKYGDPLIVGEIHGDDEARFWSKVVKNGLVPADRPDLGQCWTWIGEINWAGYGRFYFGGSKQRSRPSAHRFAYELLVGPIPDDCEIDHLCFNHACVNPAHLEAVTHAENLRRRRPFAVGRPKKVAA